jgi:hypothetical protein
MQAGGFLLQGEKRLGEGETVTAAEFELLDETEAEALIAWRLRELIEAGYALEDALSLAVAADVDLQLASVLLQRA